MKQLITEINNYFFYLNSIMKLCSITSDENLKRDTGQTCHCGEVTILGFK